MEHIILNTSIEEVAAILQNQTICFFCDDDPGILAVILMGDTVIERFQDDPGIIFIDLIR